MFTALKNLLFPPYHLLFPPYPVSRVDKINGTIESVESIKNKLKKFEELKKQGLTNNQASEQVAETYMRIRQLRAFYKNK